MDHAARGRVDVHGLLREKLIVKEANPEGQECIGETPAKQGNSRTLGGDGDLGTGPGVHLNESQRSEPSLRGSNLEEN
jgi:hypothetical protein